MGRAAAVALALLQAQPLAHAVRVMPVVPSAGPSCAELANRGTHFTVDVQVGTPSQTFAVVADTGSNTLIVPSCVCQHKGHCLKEERCFTGTNKSSSFKLDQTEDGPSTMVLSFGSGQIQGVVAKEKAKVGHVESFLEDGLLLMTDRALNINGPFEGILGLGVPQAPEVQKAAEQISSTQTSESATQESIQDVIQKILQNDGVGGRKGDKVVIQDSGEPDHSEGDADFDAMRRVSPGSSLEGTIKRKAGNVSKAHPPVRSSPPKGFLEQAKVDRFSICFNDGANGMLRLGTDVPHNAHGGVGKDHWGVDFRGISVGNKTMPAQALFCHKKHMSKGQQTPCGAIPDSGTTLLMGPEEHVDLLLAEICDGWERCRANFTALKKGATEASEVIRRIYGHNPFNLEASATKQDVVQMLLMDCASWMGEDGLSELPALHFHVVGSSGTQQTLTIPAHLYVMETSRQLMNEVRLFGAAGIPKHPKGAAGGAGKVCMPALGAVEYKTKANGPVWILGTPLFYQFVVGYDISTDPPSIAFSDQTDTPCGTCSPQVDLAARPGRTLPLRQPLRIESLPRMPCVDVSKPL